MSRVKRLTVVLLLNLGLVTALVIVGLAAHSLAVLAAGGEFSPTQAPSASPCWRSGWPAGRPSRARAGDLLDLLADRLPADPEPLKRRDRHAVALVDQARQDVLGTRAVGRAAGLRPQPGETNRRPGRCRASTDQPSRLDRTRRWLPCLPARRLADG